MGQCTVKGCCLGNAGWHAIMPSTPYGHPSILFSARSRAGAHATSVLDARPQINAEAELHVVKRDRQVEGSLVTSVGCHL